MPESPHRFSCAGSDPGGALGEPGFVPGGVPGGVLGGFGFMPGGVPGGVVGGQGFVPGGVVPGGEPGLVPGGFTGLTGEPGLVGGEPGVVPGEPGVDCASARLAPAMLSARAAIAIGLIIGSPFGLRCARRGYAPSESQAVGDYNCLL